ncbi:DUF6246 family protein, partial [Enterobacter cloacae]|uniref:DUF6246 family protein n=1 Tax=Enterobacter cloacae TaxID=550 RepID=UPI001F124098
FGFAENTDDLFVGKTLLHGDVLMWLMKTLLTSGCTNQRGAGHKSGILSRKAIMAAHAVLSACCEDDVGDLIGWMKPSKSRKRGFMWRKGIMSPQEMVIIAQSLMMHGVIGKGNLRKLQRHESNEPTNEFRASDYIIAARNHFNISKEEAAQLTMTEFQMMLVAKYPEQKGYTRDEYDSAADDYFSRRKRRLARENQK